MTQWETLSQKQHKITQSNSPISKKPLGILDQKFWCGQNKYIKRLHFYKVQQKVRFPV